MPTISIELVYVTPFEQTLLCLDVESGCTVLQAIEYSGLLTQRSELQGLAPEQLGVDIFSTPCALDTVLCAGQRIEIYRPLLCDPKKARRERANTQRTKKL